MNEWEVKLLERVVFGEKLSERPWILHTKLEPKISVHMIDPLHKSIKKDGDDYICLCGDKIPPVAMQKYFFLKSIAEGKRPGQT